MRTVRPSRRGAPLAEHSRSDHCVQPACRNFTHGSPCVRPGGRARSEHGHEGLVRCAVVAAVAAVHEEAEHRGRYAGHAPRAAGRRSVA
eukprot:CAMPEP_0206026334 /NCGR_PEP_ID=MMETSP1464-20131121/41494_1 /ASSEMBLY_ACC=CAM_ASM_001124 /TAXON_ID=119497 /ORGANISM="Exanthemachrysis gayraliae, Strain RCC1523" /LENGTH=88 /DNA_ID=CAMNT_0053400377 /DNA_START=207 /DNA_END=473 /DNA_ORIENTATION=-